MPDSHAITQKACPSISFGIENWSTADCTLNSINKSESLKYVHRQFCKLNSESITRRFQPLKAIWQIRFLISFKNNLLSGWSRGLQEWLKLSNLHRYWIYSFEFASEKVFSRKNQKQAIWNTTNSSRIIDCSIINEFNYLNWKEIEDEIWLNLCCRTLILSN